ncbi:MAG: rod shape-determining protein MreC, partial [Steroidobacteraceae bacterium]
PQGYPVARVIEVHHDTVQPSAQIRARPLAQLDRLHEVMLVWFKGDHPAAPTPPGGADSVATDLPSGNPAYQPQLLPPHPAPPAPAIAPPAGASPAGVPPASGPARKRPEAANPTHTHAPAPAHAPAPEHGR